ncbi:MAG: hypothetical protein PHD48_01235 [Alphaproteobacteria bacterium]|nr:hypothetical protein [Alphaproteobacteria bacterium]
MDWFFPLVGGLGIGSLLKGIVDHFLVNKTKVKERSYQEMREAYLGLLESLHDAAVYPSDENAKAYALWQTRCKLFGSERVSKAAQNMVDTNEDRNGRFLAHGELLDAMREDLKKA